MRVPGHTGVEGHQMAENLANARNKLCRQYEEIWIHIPCELEATAIGSDTLEKK